MMDAYSWMSDEDLSMFDYDDNDDDEMDQSESGSCSGAGACDAGACSEEPMQCSDSGKQHKNQTYFIMTR